MSYCTFWQVKGDVDGALAVLRRVAKVNKQDLPEGTLTLSRPSQGKQPLSWGMQIVCTEVFAVPSPTQLVFTTYSGRPSLMLMSQNWQEVITFQLLQVALK